MVRMLLPLLMCFGLALTGAGCAEQAEDRATQTQPEPADLILTNARVYTMAWGEPGPDGTPAADAPVQGGRWHPDAEAVAMGDGLITFVGSVADAQRHVGANTRVRDLAGATVIPGLVDSHTHVFNLGAKLGRVDLTDVATEEDAVNLIAAYAETLPKGAWVVGRGWDEGAWANNYPDKTLLSKAVPEHPVFMLSLHSFAGWANQMALDLAGINRETAAPSGGEIRRDAAGNPTGLFLNRAVPLIANAVPAASADELRRQVLLAMQQMVRDGYVTVHDAGLSGPEMAVLEDLAAEGALPLRVYAMLSIRDEPLVRRWLQRGPDRTPGDQDDFLVTRSVKAFYDGALGSRGAQLLADYSDQPGHRGVSGSTYGFNEVLAAELAEAGFQLGVHAIGDAGNRAVLDFFERTFEIYPETAAGRHRIEHAQVLHPDDLPRLAELGIVASMEPPHAVEDKTWAEERLGPERILGAYAWRSLREVGTHLTFNSDNPGSDHNIFYGLHAAVSRRDKSSQPPGGWYPDQAMTMEESLRAYTSWAAWAGFREQLTGTIALGQWADLTVLDLDPFALAESQPERLLKGRALMTVINGRVAHDQLALPGETDAQAQVPKDLRLNQLQLVGSHNSYKLAMDRSRMMALKLALPDVAKTLEYSHLPLPEQLDLGLRNLELDVFHDPAGDLYGDPEPGFKVGHVQFLDFNASCPTLARCLAEVRSWSRAHPDHLPLVITVNAKDELIDQPGFPVPLAFDAAAWQELDRVVRSALGDQLLTPAQVVTADGPEWPLLSDSRGKVLLVLDEQGDKLMSYSQDWQQRALFGNHPDGHPGAAVMVINDPVADGERIRAMVAKGYLVRTRADADTAEARSGDTRRREAAFASGAQVVTTDYYQPENPFGTDYRVQLPGGGVGRCNPVSATVACTIMAPGS